MHPAVAGDSGTLENGRAVRKRGREAMDDNLAQDLAQLHGEATTPVSARRARRRLLWMALAALASAVAAYLQR